MTTPLRVLVVEDSEDDAQLVLRQLRVGGYDAQWTRVDSPEGLRRALETQPWDVIICDYAMPHLDGLRALRIVRASGSDMPFIIVSGKIGEDTAVAAMKAGAHDYVMKDRLDRLPAAVERELRDARMRREHARAERQVRERDKALRALYRLSEIDGRRGATLEELYQETANLLPESWQHSEVACARIVIQGAEFRTASFVESPWMLAAQVQVSDGVVGKIEVGYTEERPEEDDGPFLKEEVELIQAIAQRLGSIMARRQTEEALRESEKNFRLLTEESAVGVYVIQDAKLVYVNPRIAAIFGYLPEEIMGRLALADLIHPDDLPAVMRRFQERLEGRTEESNVVYRAIEKDGSSIHIEVYGALASFRGRPAVIGTLIDVTDRERAEAALRRNAELLLEAQSVARLGSWSLDVATQTFTTSSVMDGLFGIDQDHDHSVAGWAALLHPEDRDATVHHLLNDVLGRHQPLNTEFRIIRHDDKDVRWLHALGRLELDVDGRPVAISGTSQDITARKVAELEREGLEAQLRVSQKMEAIGSLAGGVAHDFNNLLSVILSYTAFVMDVVSDGDPRKDDLVEIKNAADRAVALTRQLLAFSRKQVLLPSPLNLNQIAQGIEKMLRRILGEDIDCVLALDADLGLTLADPGQIEQVLMNLVVNARDAMPDGGKLTIETSNVEIDGKRAATSAGMAPGAYVEVAVTDTGCGLDEETQGRIFEPFFTTKETGKGTGLGLSTVFGIVKQSGGDIRVTSEPGQGCTFRILLPRMPAVSAQTANELTTGPMPATGTETILVVEDEVALRNVARRVLREAGYNVLAAADGEEALRTFALHASKIGLVLTDVVMPGMSGKVLADRLAEEHPETKVLFMSGYTDDAIVHHGVLDPAVHFISKPFTSATLRQKVREVLDR